MLRDHFLTAIIFSLLVGLFFATLNHRDRRSFLVSLGKTMAWMVLGTLVLAYVMLWTGR